MTIKALDHVNIETADVDATVAFFTDVIGLTNGDRPNFQFPGAWLYCGGRAVIHLVGTAKATGSGTGIIDHVAFEADDFDGMAAKLEARGLDFTKRDVPGGELRQIFVLDPNGVKLELNFRTSN